MKEFFDWSIGEMLDAIHCDREFANTMIYNICDYSGKVCPLTHQTCNERCKENYEKHFKTKSKQVKNHEL